MLECILALKKKFSNKFPFHYYLGPCSFIDPCWETAVAAASRSKKVQQKREEQEICKVKMDVTNAVLLPFSAVKNIKLKIWRYRSSKLG